MCVIVVGDNGGGVSIILPADPQSVNQSCNYPATYWTHSHASMVTLVNCTVASNVASQDGSRASGGGLFVSSGGRMTIQGSNVSVNTAKQFGGGIAVGTSGGAGQTGSLQIIDSAFSGNVAERGGSSIYFGSYADFVVNGSSSFDLTSGSQVASSLLSTLLMCVPGGACMCLGGDLVSQFQ